MNTNVSIREYASRDRNQVVALWNDAFNNPSGHNEPNGAIERKLAVKDGLFFVAVDGDSIAGTIMAGYDGHRGWLYSVAVNREYRRQGVGSRLVRHAESLLAILGCQKLNLQVRADNADVAAFYQSLGYDVEKRVSMGKRIGD